MKSFLYLLLLCSLFATPVLAQIGMGGTPHSSAALDVKATNKAFYPPRLTAAQRKAIADPQAGAFVFDTDKRTFYLFDGQIWSPLAYTYVTTIPTTDRVAGDGLAGDYLGGSVSISGDYALVGAHQDDVGANADQGSAYVFFRANGVWTAQAKLTASDGAASDNFGISVAISGNYALVGAKGDDIGANVNQGSAYVFIRSGTTWTQQLKLTHFDAAANDHFGWSVSLSGDYALVGVAQDDSGRGSAVVFLRSVDFWNQQFKLVASDGASFDNFGASVSISENYALVGAFLDDIGTNADQGSTYVFVRNGTIWTLQYKLTANDGAAGDNFGNSVAISGKYALVGAYGDNVNGISGQGSAYVFARDGSNWQQLAKLTDSDGLLNDHFGNSVAISGDYALVGAAQDDVGIDIDQGSVHLYHLSGNVWTLVKQITDISSANTRYGQSVSIANGIFTIGGPGFDTNKGKVAFGVVDN